MHIPTMSGFNLERHKYTLPEDLEGEMNLLLVPFQRWQQLLVDTWAPLAKKLEQEFPGFRFYEIPILQDMNFFTRTFINEGMRAGIPDPGTRRRTITLYIDKKEFLKALDLSNEETIYLFLVDRKGNILWKDEGEFSLEKGKALNQILLHQLHPIDLPQNSTRLVLLGSNQD